jgi:hypothetical protein
MDSEERKHIDHLTATGRPETDQGDYYHDAWWESYKGGVKGMLGGIFAGGLMGSVIGGLTAAALVAVAGVPMTAGAIGLMVAAFTGFGMYHGANEFAQVGTVTGAVAAAHEKSEERMKESLKAQFAELKREIKTLKTGMTGKGKSSSDDAVPEENAEPTPAEIEAKQNQHRTTHCDAHCPPSLKPIFWKVAGIGTLVGITAGAGLGVANLSTELLHPLETALHIGHEQMLAASVIVGGATGASFGINRDIFRQIFDRTDRWFHGHFTLASEKPAPVKTLNLMPEFSTPPSQAQVQPQPVVYEQPPQAQALAEPVEQSPRQPTFFQDKIADEMGRKALLALDHTMSRPC